jgi:hypothetical protein
MTSPEDLTPPTPEPLSYQRKLAMREELLASTGRSRRRRGHAWLIPGLAAAAVVAIVTVGAAVVQHGGDGPSGSSNHFAPAAGGGSSVRSTPAQGRHHSAATSAPPSREHVIRRGTHVFPIKGGALPHDPVTTCEQAIAGLDTPGLDGATVTADRSYDDYTTSLYETKSAWIVCDTGSTEDGGPPTLFSPHQKDDTYQPDLDTLAVSENYSMDDSSWAQFVAAGRDFDGVQSIRYAFPDGHVENAVVGVNGLWSMTYLPTTGPLVDPDVNQTTLDPIQVTVDYTDGHTDMFTLQWGVNTCAQLNHGC